LLFFPYLLRRRRAAIYTSSLAPITPLAALHARAVRRALVGDSRCGGPCRRLEKNRIRGTLPASLSELTNLVRLCAAPPRTAGWVRLAGATGWGRSAPATHAHTLTHTYTQAHTRTHALRHSHAHTAGCANTARQWNTRHRCVYTRMRTVCVRTHTYTHTYTRTHTHTLTHTHTHRQTDNHTTTHTRTYKHTHTHLHTLTHTHTHTHTAGCIHAQTRSRLHTPKHTHQFCRKHARTSALAGSTCAAAARDHSRAKNPDIILVSIFSGLCIASRIIACVAFCGGLCRFLENQMIGGTVPASLSALINLAYMCAAPPRTGWGRSAATARMNCRG
jgi:hypothetical protein